MEEPKNLEDLLAYAFRRMADKEAGRSLHNPITKAMQDKLSKSDPPDLDPNNITVDEFEPLEDDDDAYEDYKDQEIKELNARR